MAAALSGSMPRKRPSIVEDLVLSPWWLSASLGVVALVALPIVLGISTKNPFVALLKPYWPVVAIGLFCLSGLSALRAWANGRMLDRQTGIDSLIELSWKEFEDLMAEAFRRKGYGVEEMLGAGADGGVDLVLRRGGEKILVQCKRWRNKPVPVAVVREMYGLLMADLTANSTKLVTTSGFTSEAIQFAKDKPIDLIGNYALLTLLHGVQRSQAGSARIALAAETSSSPSCPKCDSEMVRRTARKGPSAGQDFWGCSNYPECRGTRPC
jgi:restriction system protein